MKRNVFLDFALLVLGCSFMFLLGACSEQTVVDGREDLILGKKEFHTATLVAKLPEGAVKTRLVHESGMSGSNTSILTKWEIGDKVVINFNPSDETTNCYPFTLKDGAGTNYGTFENTSMPNNPSKQWIMYFPGDAIQCEKDFLEHSYDGQIQVGNDNLNHLKNYHTIRYVREFSEATTFVDEIIDFSGEGMDESSCFRFKLTNLPSMTPTKVELAYINPTGAFEDIFYTHNCLSSYFSDSSESYSPNVHKTSHMSLTLQGFSVTDNITAYMMMSNYPMTVSAGGKFRIIVTATTDKYYCDVNINTNVTLEGGSLYGISCNAWTKADMIDGFENPTEGVVVLQQATKGNVGADIIIMGDGFSKDKFASGGEYATVMNNAYDDFFSIEPLKSLKNYFNVYYINAVSTDNHDATPYWSGGSVGNGLQNGATQGTANTVFKTIFEENQTTITGNNTMALQYAMQAIRSKGSSTGGEVNDEEEVYRRAHTALVMVMVNVKCHAGTCHSVIIEDASKDYGNAYSVAYTALGHDGTGGQCKWTTIHEAAGHGFGKLADEYGGNIYLTFYTSDWQNLNANHSYGYYRNVNEYWNSTDEYKWKNVVGSKDETTTSNVYWSPLMLASYLYSGAIDNTTKGEGLKVYRGGYTFDELYCRPTNNSVMREQFAENGQFFNAVSRWAIWYRLMRLTGTGNYSNFSSSLSDFIDFDIVVPKNQSVESRGVLRPQELKPLAPPVMKTGRWVNGRLVTE